MLEICAKGAARSRAKSALWLCLAQVFVSGHAARAWRRARKLLNASSSHAVMYSALQSCKYTVVVLVRGGARMSARKSSSDVKLPKIHWLKDSRLPGKCRALARVLDRSNFAWLSDAGLFFRIYKLRCFLPFLAILYCCNPFYVDLRSTLSLGLFAIGLWFASPFWSSLLVAYGYLHWS